MVDSSFIISPVSAQFSDVWSEPELLCSEGCNALYVATRFGRKYVLKALAEPYRESTPHLEMLRKEFSIGVAVDHPNIVRLLDFGHMDSIGWYIQMEYIDGITLERFLETRPAASVRRRILSQLLDALAFLHERQIIHRDIKPSNILITRNGSTVKLIDFGVSDTDDYVTFKQPAGSMAYIAPEQLAGKAIDNRADIFSIGRIIELLFPHRYRAIARRCTRENPARRYSSCVRVARAILNIDRLRVWLPLSVLVIFIPLVAIWQTYEAYRKSEQTHSQQEIQLNKKPTEEELMRAYAIRVHRKRYMAMREAVESGEIKTQRELKNWDKENLNEEFSKSMRSIRDPYTKEKFREAYFAYYLHTRHPLYDSLYHALPPE